jgi:hypothetical protein
MSVFDLLRQEYVKGKVVGKYRLGNGNVGLVVEQQGTNRRYHVQFRDDYSRPCIENLYGLLNDPFAGKTKALERLISEGDQVELTLSYSKGPFRESYRVHSVSRPNPAPGPYKMLPDPGYLPLRQAKTTRY